MAAELAPDIMPKPGEDLAAALRLGEKTLGEARGVVIAVQDRVPSNQLAELETFRQESSLPIHFFAIAADQSPELQTIRDAATKLSATVTVITPDATDIDALVRQAAKSARLVTTSGEGTRWAESGWWLTPAIALISLLGFRRETSSPSGAAG